MNGPPADNEDTAFLADLGRSRLLTQRAGVTTEIDERLRQDPRGVARHTPSLGMLTLSSLSLATFKNARVDAMENTRDKVLPSEAVDWLGLRGPTGHPITRHDMAYYFRIFSDNHDPSKLRPRPKPKSRTADAAERVARNQRLLTLMGKIAWGWIPREFPTGDVVAFDATPLESARRPLPASLRERLVKEDSHDLLLNEERSLPRAEQQRLRTRRAHRAWGARWGHATKTYSQPKRTIGGWHLHTATICAPPDSPNRPPALLVGIAITPAAGYRPRRMLRRLLAPIDARWGTHLMVIADRDYSKDLGLWQQLRDAHRTFVFDLRKDQLPPRGTHGGALLLQGIPFCPGTPAVWRNPGKRPLRMHKGQPNPKHVAWREIIEARAPYRCVLRARRPKGITVSCPHGRYVQCELCADLDPASRLPIVVDPPPRTAAPPICTKPTVFIPDTANPLRQLFPWALAKWESRYSRGRAAIEGDHGQLKAADQLGLTRWVTRSSRIDVVGLFVAQIVALYNLRKIRRWIDQNPEHPVAAKLVTDPLFASDAVVAEWVRQQLGDQAPEG